MKLILRIAVCVAALLAGALPVKPQQAVSGPGRTPQWQVEAGGGGAYVPATNTFLKGGNPLRRQIGSDFTGMLRAGFSFNPATREGMLFRGLYQGVGIESCSFPGANSLLGAPLSAYVFQGAPIVRFSRNLWLGYEWQFGAAFGWKHYDKETAPTNASVSTSVTARMYLGLRLDYTLSERWRIAFGAGATHFSNGNTSLPNGGVNTLGVSLSLAYVLNPQPDCEASDVELEAEADKGEWFYDITAFGAWRRRIVEVDGNGQQLCPGRFGVAGIQVAPMRKLCRMVAVGGAVDMQWDESGGLAPYWVEGTTGDGIMFYRPPFQKQIHVGVSAHVELTMPIFSVNAGVGYDFITPAGDKRFYQSLTLKTFVTRWLYLSTGYRLGNFKDPQNLLLGAGIRL